MVTSLDTAMADNKENQIFGLVKGGKFTASDPEKSREKRCATGRNCLNDGSNQHGKEAKY